MRTSAQCTALSLMLSGDKFTFLCLPLKIHSSKHETQTVSCLPRYNCQFTYWFILFMHVTFCWIIHTTFYGVAHQSHLETHPETCQNPNRPLLYHALFLLCIILLLEEISALLHSVYLASVAGFNYISMKNVNMSEIRICPHMYHFSVAINMKQNHMAYLRNVTAVTNKMNKHFHSRSALSFICPALA